MPRTIIYKLSTKSLASACGIRSQALSLAQDCFLSSLRTPAPPTSYSVNSKSNFTSSGNNSNLTNITTDFEIPMSETKQCRPVIYYNPSSEYRLVDTRSIINMSMLDITVFWKTPYGEYIPLKLQPGCAAHIKLLFRHRTFNFVNDL